MILILVSGKYQVRISNRFCVAEALVFGKKGASALVFFLLIPANSIDLLMVRGTVTLCLKAGDLRKRIGCTSC